MFVSLKRRFDSMSSKALYLVFIAVIAENLFSHKYVVANGIKNFTDWQETSGYSLQIDSQKVNRLEL